MSRKKRRLSRHDDRSGSAMTLWHLWQIVAATEEVDGDDDAFTDEMWTYYAHRIAYESECADDIPDLCSPLGPLGGDQGPGYIAE